jgi:carbon storage regulator
MLVLTRKLGEEIVIGNDIRVRVVAVQGNQVRLGFTAPKEISIQREELLRPRRVGARLPEPDAIVEEDREATLFPPEVSF